MTPEAMFDKFTQAMTRLMREPALGFLRADFAKAAAFVFDKKSYELAMDIAARSTIGDRIHGLILPADATIIQDHLGVVMITETPPENKWVVPSMDQHGNHNDLSNITRDCRLVSFTPIINHPQGITWVISLIRILFEKISPSEQKGGVWCHAFTIPADFMIFYGHEEKLYHNECCDPATFDPTIMKAIAKTIAMTTNQIEYASLHFDRGVDRKGQAGKTGLLGRNHRLYQIK